MRFASFGEEDQKEEGEVITQQQQQVNNQQEDETQNEEITIETEDGSLLATNSYVRYVNEATQNEEVELERGTLPYPTSTHVH